MKGKYSQDWHRVERFVIPLPAVPHNERRQRLCEDQAFAIALITAGCYEPEVEKLFDDAERMLQRLRGVN